MVERTSSLRDNLPGALAALVPEEGAALSRIASCGAIRPDEAWKVRWDLFMAICVLYMAVAVPVQVAFPSLDEMDGVDIFVGACARPVPPLGFSAGCMGGAVREGQPGGEVGERGVRGTL
jgi:hypothetical protein